MRPHSVPCCGESGRVRTSGHRTRPGTLTRPGQRRPIHPLGPQRMAHSRRRAALSITDGHGLHQPPGGKTGEIRAGAIVCTPAGERHRHRATPGHFMTHLPITEAVPGGRRPEANRASTSPTRSTTRTDAVRRPFPASRSTPLPGMTGTRRHADRPDLRPVGSMPSRHIGSAEAVRVRLRYHARWCWRRPSDLGRSRRGARVGRGGAGCPARACRAGGGSGR
jgi:hypothetical protein